ncbi:MarR family winged helix-turn-helix transcriptional regulator [Stigmatella aurantiaca]|nr:MarR family transcriptional regulator [Stigmatella aurantiaca]ADO75005.1 Transcriptional regulator, MarR family [Stigmatella aurantiaca DW4/3-1]
MAGEQKKSPASSEERLAREAWAPLFELIQEQMRHFPALAAEFELSPVQAHVLRMLGCGPQPMSALADYLSCDASNVTGLVDRLEGRGLMERRSAEHDRRVKLLCLTEAGRALRQRLQERMLEPPEVIVALTSQEKRSLRDILSQAMERLAAQKPQGRSARGDASFPGAREG